MRTAPDYIGRQQRLWGKLGEEPGTAFLTNQPSDIEYLTGLPSSPACLLVACGERALLLIDESRWNGAVTEGVEAELCRVTAATGLARLLAAAIARRGVSRLLCEDLPLSLVEALGQLGAPRVQRPGPVLAPLRRSKESIEQERLRRAAQLADRCMEAARRALRPGIPELEVAAEIDHEVKTLGGDGTWFPTVVSSGQRAAIPVYPAARKIVEPGDLVVVDIGVKLDAYCADITRTFVVGAASDRALQILRTVLHAQREALGAVRAGAPVDGVDEKAREVFEAAGWREYITHATGHGLGLGKEPPALAAGVKDVLLENECVTVEPGVYFPGFGGARIEDDVLVQPGGAEILTRFSKDLEHLILEDRKER